MKVVIVVIVILVLAGIVFFLLKMRKGKQGNIGMSGGEHKDQFNPTTVIGGGPSLGEPGPTTSADKIMPSQSPTPAAPLGSTPAPIPTPSASGEPSFPGVPASAPPKNPGAADFPTPESEAGGSQVSAQEPPAPSGPSINVGRPAEDPKQSDSGSNTSSTV